MTQDRAIRSILVAGGGIVGWLIATGLERLAGILIGKIILANGAVPHTDLFAFTKPGEAWYAFEWLSETVFALAHNAAGLKGLTFLAGMLISLYFTVLFKHAIWKGASGLFAIVVTLMAVTATLAGLVPARLATGRATAAALRVE